MTGLFKVADNSLDQLFVLIMTIAREYLHALTIRFLTSYTLRVALGY